MEDALAAPMADPGERDGLLARGLTILKRLAGAGRSGIALTTLARQSGLPLSTTHRLLNQLLVQRLAMQLEGSRRYAIGPLAYELGLAAAQQFDIRALCQPAIEQLAQRSSETVYLLQRSGLEAVCLDLKQGPGTVRVATLQIGSRRPLGLGAGGLAMLAALPPEEARMVLDAVAENIQREWRLPSAQLQSSLEQAQRQGWSMIRNRITPGVTAIGRSFCDSLGQVFGAVTIAGASSRMTDDRLDSLREHLHEAAQVIEQALRSHQWARYAARL